MENLVVDCLLVNLRTLCSVSIIEIISSLWTTECRDQYPNVCTLWYDFCDPDALKYKVLRQSVEFIKANCPVTCKKCQPGQRLLKSSRNLNGKWFFILYFFRTGLDLEIFFIVVTLGWVKEIDLSPHEELWGIEFQIFTFCSPVHYQEITKNSWAKPLRPAKPELISLFIILLQNDYRCLSVKWKTTNEGTSVTRLTSSEIEKDERWTAKQRALHCAVPCATVFIDN